LDQVDAFWLDFPMKSFSLMIIPVIILFIIQGDFKVAPAGLEVSFGEF
jgi:hypothetical protein